MFNLWRVMRSALIQYGQALSVELSYRAAFLQTVLSELVGMLGVLMFWVTIGKTASGSRGYTTELLVAYFFFASAFAMLADDGLARNLSMDIRTGKLSASLLRPHPFIYTVVSRSLAFVTVRVAALLPLLCIAVYFLPGSSAYFLSLKLTNFFLVFLATTLALLSGWAVKSIVGLLAFRLTQTWGPELIYLSIFSIASGERFPPDVLPEFLKTVVSWSPFYYMIGFPTLVVTGRLTGEDVTTGLLRGSLVTAVCAAFAFALWRRGLRRFEAIGI